jgi:MFS family permease
MVAGARHAWARPPAAAALLAIALHRVCFGFLTLMTLLLYRNGVHSWGVLFPAGLTGLSEVLGAGAVGTLLAAVVTPRVVRRLGKPRTITMSLVGGAVTQVGLGLPFLPPTIVAAGLTLGFVTQAIKICVDTTLQETVDDDYRGRVFSVYDTLYNVTFVAAVVLAALVLPASGVSYPLLIAVGTGYLLAAAGYARLTHRP